MCDLKSLITTRLVDPIVVSKDHDAIHLGTAVGFPFQFPNNGSIAFDRAQDLDY